MPWHAPLFGVARGDRTQRRSFRVAFFESRSPGLVGRLHPSPPNEEREFRMSVPYRVKVLLAYRSGDVCALQDCHEQLSPEGSGLNPLNIGEAAHIAGEHAGTGQGQRSARYDPHMTPEERNSVTNLIYVCPTCHRKIDAIPDGEISYPVSRLLDIKQEHEGRIAKAVTNEFQTVNFSELERATQWILNEDAIQRSYDFSRVPIETKIRLNRLGPLSRTVITTHLANVRSVGEYIQEVSLTEPSFPERLKAGFLRHYHSLRHDGVEDNDTLFDFMCAFAQAGLPTQGQRFAGQAILVYLFESCDLFER